VNLRKTFAVSFVFLLILSSSAIAQTASPNDSAIAQLQTGIPNFMQQADIPGLSIALIRHGKTEWLHAFGVKNAQTNQPVGADTIFEAASLSKPVFAYGVLKLVDQGKLSLDTPLTSYLPKPYIDGDPRLEKITARIVLSHRTGFPNWRNGNSLTIKFTPGERFSYSGEGFVYLQKVVEQITGKPLNDFMTETVFIPLHMSSSSYVWRAEYEDRTATGHDSDAGPRPKGKPTEANAASSLHTTAHDYALFLEAILHGTGLKSATLRQLETPQIAVDPECTNCTDRMPKELSKILFWGLGWGIQRTADRTALWHWGDNGAFKCFVMIVPKEKSGVVFFANSENGLAVAPAIAHDALGAEGAQPVFTWLHYDAYDSPALQFSKAVREKGVTLAIQQFEPKLKIGDISESAINGLGYSLLARNQPADAIRIFQLNVDLHPQSSNTYDSLGEAYMDAKEKSLAIQNYQKSLQLNPNNTNATAMLKKLREN
jgi:CubicO group peptidase (beta-lactamase class C family)